MKISEYFTLEELTFSEAAARLGLDNIPSAIVVTNLGLVAEVMERIRTLLGEKPIVVHSGYRSIQCALLWLGLRLRLSQFWASIRSGTCHYQV